MAGQPPEPSWQPAGQDQTQARAAWPRATASAAGAAAAALVLPRRAAPPQDGYGYPQQPAPGYPPPGYAAPGQEQASVSSRPPARTTRSGSCPACRPDRPGAAQKAAGERGFVGSLFDFSFTSFVTPKIIKVLYVLFTIWTALVSLLILIISFRTGGMLAGIFVLIVIVPIYVLLTLGVYRVILEAFMVVFRIYEETKKISERTQSQV